MKKNLNNEELNNVTGGNYGDEKLEASNTPEGVKFLYNVGDHVEVYSLLIHTVTDGGTIIERSTTDCSVDCTTQYVGYYKVHFDDGSSDRWVCANEIERNE